MLLKVIFLVGGILMDSVIFDSKLVECDKDIVAHLQSHGVKCCAYCNKSFTSARRPHSTSRSSHIDTQINTWSFILCRKCTRIAKQPNNLVHASLFKKAQSEHALLVATVKGTS